MSSIPTDPDFNEPDESPLGGGAESVPDPVEPETPYVDPDNTPDEDAGLADSHIGGILGEDPTPPDAPVGDAASEPTAR